MSEHGLFSAFKLPISALVIVTTSGVVIWPCGGGRREHEGARARARARALWEAWHSGRTCASGVGGIRCIFCVWRQARQCANLVHVRPRTHTRARARAGEGEGGGGEGEGGGTGGPRIARKRTHHGQAAPFLFIPPAHHPARVGALAPLDRQRLAEHRGCGPGGGGQRQRHGGREGRGRAHGAPRVHPCVRAGTLRAACAVATLPPRPTHPYPPALRRALRRPVAPPTSVGRGTRRGTKSRNRCRGTYPRESMYRAYITSM